MSFLIALIGLPASGKGYVGEKLSKIFKFPFFPEVATEILKKEGYVIGGFKLPYEFDEKVFELNRKRVEETEQLLAKTPVIWESHILTDTTFLMGRAFFGDNDPKRFKLLQKYQTTLLNKLKDRTIFVILDIDPEVSLKRQKEKGQLITPDIKLLKYVRSSFLNFYKKKKKSCILIDVTDKDLDEVVEEIKDKLQEKMEAFGQKLSNN